MRGRLAAVRQRATDSRGIALSEMIVVMAILLIVLTALTQLFVSASTAEVDMSKRVQAQQDARLALDSLRREIHCAKRRDATLRQRRRSRSRSARTARDEQHPALQTPTITWCTRRAPALRRSRSWRYTGSTCSRDGPESRADYLTTGAVFTAYVPPKSSTPVAREHAVHRRPVRAADEHDYQPVPLPGHRRRHERRH